jgi:nucleoside-diphosphate-sugar epimerase
VCAAVRRGGMVPAGAAEQVTVGDIGPVTNWDKPLQGIECVIHLAARVHMIREPAADPAAAFRTVNVEGTRSLAKAAASAGVRRFIFLSSIKAMAEEGVALTESSAAQPADPYGRSKLEAEQALREIALRPGMSLFILRPPLVYGPGVGANFRRLLDLVDSGWPLPLGGVRNRRSIIYVGNLADAVACSVRAPEHVQGTYLLHDGEPLSTPDLIRRIADALGRPARLLPVPAPMLEWAAGLLGQQEAWKRLAGSLTIDDRAFRLALGWTPPYTIEDGLRATAIWYRGLAQAG